MKRNVSWTGLVAVVFGLIGLGAWAETSRPLPTPFPEARYQQMSAKSPFAVASAAAATAAPTPGFAAQLYVDGVAHVGKTDFVAIKSRDPDQQTVFFLEVGGTAPDGMKVEGVHWSDQMGKSTVDVTKAGEKATLIFDEQQMAKNAAAAPGGPPMPGQPGVRLPTLPGQQPRPGFPNNPAFVQPGGQYNRRLRVFPGQPANGAPGQPAGPVPGVDVRRRVRMIQSGQ